MHSRILKFHIEDRAKQIEKNKVDWATAEAMAFASLLDEGFNIRMTG